MLVRALAPCYVERQFHEAGDVFEWRNVNSEPLPACMEVVESEPVTPEAEPEEPASAKASRPSTEAGIGGGDGS